MSTRAEPNGSASSGTAASTDELQRNWLQLMSGLDACEERLTRELAATSSELEALLERQRTAARHVLETLADLTPASYIGAREAATRDVLLDPLARLDRRHPLDAAQRSFQDYYQGVDALVRRIANACPVSGRSVLALVDGAPDGAIARRVASWRGKARPLPLRDVLAPAVYDGESETRKAEGVYLVAIVHGLKALQREWDYVRTRTDLEVGEGGDDATPVDEGSHVPQLARAVGDAIVRLESIFARRRQRAARALLRAAAWGRVRSVDRSTAARTRQFDLWATQSSLLRGELALERTETSVERSLLSVLDRAMDSLEGERRRLIGEIDAHLTLLAAVDSPVAAVRAFPDATAAVVPAQSRTRETNHAVAELLASLPDSIAILTRVAPAGRRRASTRTAWPRRTAEDAYANFGKPGVAELFAQGQETHLRMVQHLERARQVVEFAAEGGVSAEAGAEAGAVDEALHNARALLAGVHQELATPIDASRDAAFAAAAQVFLENRLMLARGRLGTVVHRSGLGARRGAGSAVAAAGKLALSGIAALASGAAASVRRFLVAIEWIPPAHADRPSVFRRPYLPSTFVVEPTEQPLPAIYRRLFRFDAVSDARFLIGREREMRAFEEARAFWETGRPVAVVVVGERGSGKTSLVNCALNAPLAGLPVVRGEFDARLTSAAEVRRQLAALLALDDQDAIESYLLSDRRIVVLEETERTFLREIGGFEGVRHLQRLIAATCSTTLWLVVTNQHAFRFLHAAARFGDTFSHRMDAASASADALRESILVRHNLSGLRLRFEPPPVDGTLTARLRRRLLGAADPERDFFAALARESGGVFRSAFQLWLGQVQSVDGGTLTMKPVARPDLDAVVSELDAADVFTLVAVMQHGSLTATEHSRVFQRPLQASQAQLDELLARELIEDDPGRPGYRVRPRALRVVNEALHRRNLG